MYSAENSKLKNQIGTLTLGPCSLFQIFWHILDKTRRIHRAKFRQLLNGFLLHSDKNVQKL
jgi:hypothetical protein